MDSQRADRVADRVAEKRVFVFGGFHHLALLRIDRRQDQAAMQRQGQRRREEETDGQHMCRIVVEMQILVARVRHPIEVAHDPVGKAVAPGAEQHRADHDE